MAYQDELNTSRRYLMGPGPSDVHPRVLKAMATPLIGHLDPEFVDIMDDIKAMAQRTFQTQNHLTFVVSAPGSAGMETCLVNLLEPGDEALICIHGLFGGRMADIAERCGAKVIRVEAPWGGPVDPQQVKAAWSTAAQKCSLSYMPKPPPACCNPWRRSAGWRAKAAPFSWWTP